jgi:hypothetical protein
MVVREIKFGVKATPISNIAILRSANQRVAVHQILLAYIRITINANRFELSKEF